MSTRDPMKHDTTTEPESSGDSACSAWVDLREQIDALGGSFDGYAWDNGAGSSGYNKAINQILSLVDELYPGEPVHACPNCASSVSWFDRYCYSCKKPNAERIHGGDETPNPNKTLPAVG